MVEAWSWRKGWTKSALLSLQSNFMQVLHSIPSCRQIYLHSIHCSCSSHSVFFPQCPLTLTAPVVIFAHMDCNVGNKAGQCDCGRRHWVLSVLYRWRSQSMTPVMEKPGDVEEAHKDERKIRTPAVSMSPDLWPRSKGYFATQTSMEERGAGEGWGI